MKTALITTTLALSAGLGSSAYAQDLTSRPAPPAGSVIIYDATIHTITGDTIGQGFVEISAGKITRVERGDPPADAPGQRVRATGQHVYPGLIAPLTRLGLAEIQAVRASDDYNEAGNITPEVRASTAVNPDSTFLPVTRTNGILIAGTLPTGGLFPGQASVIALNGWTSEQMTIAPTWGQVIAWPTMRVIKAWWMDKSEEDQLRDIRTRLEQIRTTLATARSYARLKAAEPGTPTDLRYEALAKALPGPNGEKPAVPVLIEAQEYDQITSAIAMASEFGLRPIILGGRDAPLCAELLKKHDIPVIVDGVHALPRRDDAPFDDNFTLPARLNAAGVRIAIASGEETAHERNLPYVVARACAHGLPHEVAIKSVTIEAAKIMGVANRLGSIEVGKDATLIITTGDPLEVDVHVTGAWIGGVPVDLSNKQSVLAERYREKYRQSKVKNEK